MSEEKDERLLRILGLEDRIARLQQEFEAKALTIQSLADQLVGLNQLREEREHFRLATIKFTDQLNVAQTSNTKLIESNDTLRAEQKELIGDCTQSSINAQMYSNQVDEYKKQIEAYKLDLGTYAVNANKKLKEWSKPAPVLNFKPLRDAQLKRMRLLGSDGADPASTAVELVALAEALLDKVRKYQDLNLMTPVSSLSRDLGAVVVYCDWLAAQIGLDLGTCTVDSFNEVSRKYGYTDDQL